MGPARRGHFPDSSCGVGELVGVGILHPSGIMTYDMAWPFYMPHPHDVMSLDLRHNTLSGLAASLAPRPRLGFPSGSNAG